MSKLIFWTNGNSNKNNMSLDYGGSQYKRKSIFYSAFIRKQQPVFRINQRLRIFRSFQFVIVSNFFSYPKYYDISYITMKNLIIEKTLFMHLKYIYAHDFSTTLKILNIH